jgi:hypothetical protein
MRCEEREAVAEAGPLSSIPLGTVGECPATRILNHWGRNLRERTPTNDGRRFSGGVADKLSQPFDGEAGAAQSRSSVVQCPDWRNGHMQESLFHRLTRAIDERAVVVVCDEAGERVIEPYLIFESAAGDMLLHGWQREGAFRDQPPPRWCNLYLEDIVDVKVTTERFLEPRPDYNASGGRFHRLVYELNPQRRAANRDVPERRPGRERRRPPQRTGSRRRI